MGIRKMLMLVWTKDAAIKEALKEAYNVLYLSPPAVLFSLSLSLSLSFCVSSSPSLFPLLSCLFMIIMKTFDRSKAALCVSGKLISMTVGATLAELTSLEELICSLMKENLISNEVIDTLTDIFGTHLHPPLSMMSAHAHAHLSPSLLSQQHQDSARVV